VNGTVQPKCECFDPSDTSPGCSDSLLPNGDFLDDATGLFDNVQEDFFDPLVSVFVDHPDKWTSSSWAWASGLLIVFFVMLLCICSTFWPGDKKDCKEKYSVSGSPVKSPRSRSPSKKRPSSEVQSSHPSPRDSSNRNKPSSPGPTRKSSSSRRERSSSSSSRNYESSVTYSKQRSTSTSYTKGLQYDYQKTRVSPRNYPVTSNGYQSSLTSDFVPQMRASTRYQTKTYDNDYDSAEL
jgi:hypothetical protein